MNNELTIGIIGLYTIVYVIIFFIQKSQIKKTKEINEAMKSFMEIFKVDEVKKYVELKDEMAIMQVKKILANDAKLIEYTKEAMEEHAENFNEEFENIVNENYVELVMLLSEIISAMPQEEQKPFIKKALPKSYSIFSNIVDRINQQKSKGE